MAILNFYIMNVLIFDYEFALESCKKNDFSQVSVRHVIGQNALIQQDSGIILSSVSQEEIHK